MSEIEPRGQHAAVPENSIDAADAPEGKPLASRRASHAVRPEVLSNGASIAERLHDFAENRNPYNPPERLYTDRRSDQVNRLDGQPLARPFHLPTRVKVMLGCVVAVAAVGGGVFVHSVADGVLLSGEREQAAIRESLSKEVDLGLPVLKDLSQLDDATIQSDLAASGETIVDINALQGKQDEGLDLYKIPEGLTQEQAMATAAAMLTTGLVSGSDAVDVLNGGWRLMVDRGEYLNLNLRYADFQSQTAEDAIAAAIASQGLDGTATSETSQDSSGNTIQTGTVDIAGIPYAWQVSACPLSDVYKIDGIPDSAQYVGIRVHQ